MKEKCGCFQIETITKKLQLLFLTSVFSPFYRINLWGGGGEEGAGRGVNKQNPPMANDAPINGSPSFRDSTVGVKPAGKIIMVPAIPVTTKPEFKT